MNSQPAQDIRRELCDLYHIARTAMADRVPSRYDRMCYVKREYVKAHPEVLEQMSGKRLWLLIDECTQVL